MPDTTLVVGEDDYNKPKRKVDSYFLPKKTKNHSRYAFSKQDQSKEKSVDTYVALLREKSSDCEFAQQTKDRILKHLIQIIKDSKLEREKKRSEETGPKSVPRGSIKEKTSARKSKT